jgi:hypothetical protein
MKIDFERKGGFAGIHLKTSIDTENLPIEERNTIHTLVNESEFFKLNSEIDSSNVRGPSDSLKYKITIKENDKIHTLEATDRTMNTRIRPLLTYLGKKAIENRKEEK